MKKTITFEAADCDRFDDAELNRVMHATSAYIALFDINNYIKGELKKDLSEELYEAISVIQDAIYAIIDSNNINMEDLP